MLGIITNFIPCFYSDVNPVLQLFFLLHTFFAMSVKKYGMLFNAPGKLMLRQKIDVLQPLHLQIYHLSALLADKVIVWLGISVKTVWPYPCRDRLDLPDICQ